MDYLDFYLIPCEQRIFGKISFLPEQVSTELYCLEVEITRNVPNEQVEGPIKTNICSLSVCIILSWMNTLFPFLESNLIGVGGWPVASSLSALLSGDRAFFSIISLPERRIQTPPQRASSQSSPIKVSLQSRWWYMRGQKEKKPVQLSPERQKDCCVCLFA